MDENHHLNNQQATKREHPQHLSFIRIIPIPHNKKEERKTNENFLQLRSIIRYHYIDLFSTSKRIDYKLLTALNADTSGVQRRHIRSMAATHQEQGCDKKGTVSRSLRQIRSFPSTNSELIPSMMNYILQFSLFFFLFPSLSSFVSIILRAYFPIVLSSSESP